MGKNEVDRREMDKKKIDKKETDKKDTDKKETGKKQKKRILITGAGSYIGQSVEAWLGQYPGQYQVDTLDMEDENWKKARFELYDAVFHVAGIAHSDTGRISEEKRRQYYQVNTKLTLETARRAKAAGVRQFLFMSSMIVYEGAVSKSCRQVCGRGQTGKAVRGISKATKPKAANCYGDSKLQAEKGLQKLAGKEFKVVILRPPMIYGKGCKGNYPRLAKLAAKSPVFPQTKNRRSMLYIDNLCELVRLLIDREEMGIVCPQNKEYVDTSELVRLIAEAKGHKIWLVPFTGGILKLVSMFPWKIGALFTKIAGDFYYEQELSEYEGGEYRVCTWKESVYVCEQSCFHIENGT